MISSTSRWKDTSACKPTISGGLFWYRFAKYSWPVNGGVHTKIFLHGRSPFKISIPFLNTLSRFRISVTTDANTFSAQCRGKGEWVVCLNTQNLPYLHSPDIREPQDRPANSAIWYSVALWRNSCFLGWSPIQGCYFIGRHVPCPPTETAGNITPS